MIFSNFFFTFLSSFVGSMNELESSLGESLLDVTQLFTIYSVTAVAVFLVFFILKGIGIYALSKNNGVDKGWLGFIPFLSFYQMGRLIGPMRIFRIRFENVGILIAIAYFVVIVMGAVLDYLMYFETFEKVYNSGSAALAFDAQGNLISNDNWILLSLSLIQGLMHLIVMIIMLFVLITFFRLYSPRRSFIFAVLSFFFEPLLGVFVFVVRKNKKGSFYAYNPYSYAGNNGFRNETGTYDNSFKNDNSDPFSDHVNNGSPSDVFEDYPDTHADNTSDPGKDRADDENDLF